MPTILFGQTQAASGGAVKFAHDLAPQTWISIPESFIASVEPAGGGSGASRSKITLNDPVAPGGEFIGALIDMLGQSIIKLGDRVRPAVTAKATGAEGSPACIDCLNRCQLIVLTPDNPFAQIECMLACSACP